MLSIKKIEKICVMLQLSGIMLLLFLAFFFEIVMNELPCPLCILQRIGFLATAFGFLMNLRFGLRPSHYAMALIGALFTSFVALRQIALHVVPGTGTYGQPVLGMHLYSWSFVFSMITIVVTTIMMGVDRQYQNGNSNGTNGNSKWLTHVFFAIVVFLIASNMISVFMLCGPHECPDNPVQYHY